MGYPSRTPAWFRYLRFWSTNVASDIDDELRFHVDARIAELMAQGLQADMARAQTVEEFGDMGAVRTSLREIDGRIAQRQTRAEVLDGIKGDTIYAIRALRRTPAVTATIVVTLALGLGMNAAMFSFLDQVFARQPVGVARPAAIHRLWWVIRFGEARTPTFWPGFSYPSYQVVTDAVGDRARTAIYSIPSRARLGRGENAPEASVVSAGPGYFDMLGVQTAAGRLFTAEESRPGTGANVAVISDAFWRRTFQADPSAVGRVLKIDNRPYTIVGIARPGFTGLDLEATDIWLPMGSMTVAGSPAWWQSRDNNGFAVLLRPTPGVSNEQIEDRATLALRTLDRAGGRPIDSVNVARLGSIVKARGPGKPSAEVAVATRLAGVAAIVLLIACANVINLLLARAVHRRREIAVRLALGVSRARLVRLLVVESVLLAMMAALAAVIAAGWGGSLLRTLLLPDVHWATSPLHWRVVLFALVAALGAGVVAGLIPAWMASRPDLAGALKAGVRDGGPQRSRLRSGLVMAQAALSVMLLAGAALFVKSLQNVHQLRIGFDADRLLFADVRFDTRDSVRDANYGATVRQIADRFRAVPNVEQVALAGLRPMGGFGFINWFSDKTFVPGKQPTATYSAVSPQFFATTGLRVLHGSGFPSGIGGATQRVVVVNQAMANAVWPGESPLGRCMRFEKSDGPCYTIAGVVENATRSDIVEDPTAQFYLPIDNLPSAGARRPSLIIRAAPERLSVVAAEVRRALLEAWPTGEPRIKRMSEVLEPQYRPWRLGATLFSTFGLLALVIAAVGIFSTISYGVTQRTHEFGVRVALGAGVGDVVRQVIGEGLRTVALGVAIGVALALASGRMIASLLYGIGPRSPSVILIVAAILLAVAMFAALVPAWRAAGVDPVKALRTD